MFYCSCGKEVRAIYCPDENQYMPDDVCQDCYDLQDDTEDHVELVCSTKQDWDDQEELPF